MRLLLACIFIELVGLGMMIPLIPFMALRFGAGPQEVTLLSATFSLALLIAAPLWGRASDRWGRRPVLLISFAGTMASFFLLAVADALWVLFLARTLAGLLSGEMAAGPAYIADVSEPEHRAKSMGLLGAAFGLSFVIGPGLGAALAGGDPATADFRTPALIATGLAGTALVVAAIFLPESRKREQDEAPKPTTTRGWRAVLVDLHFPNLPLVALILFLIGCVFSSMESTLALWTNEALAWGPRQVGYLLVFAGLVAVVVQGGLIGPLNRRFGETRLVIAAAVLLGLGMALLPLSTGLPLLLPAVACLAAGFGLGNPALQSLISQLSGRERAGGALGVGQATTSAARVAGPPVAGFLFETQGRGAPYFAGALVMVVVVVLAMTLRRRIGDRPAAQPAE